MEANEAGTPRTPKLVEYLRDHVTLDSADGTILYSNASITPMLGYSAEEYVGQRQDAFVHPDDVLKTQAFFRELAAEPDATRTIELRCRHKQGHDVWVELVATNKLDDPQIGAIVSNSRDISERKRDQAALAEEHNLLRAMIDTLPDMIWIKDRQHRFVMRNAARGSILNTITPEDIVGKTDADLPSNQDWQQFQAEEEAIFTTGVPLVNHHEQLTGADGQPIWISTTKVPLRNLSGEIIGLVGASRDITERKLREQQLRYQASLQENVSDAVISTDLNYRIQSWNQAAERIYGWTAGDAVGKSIDILQTEYETEDQLRQMRNELFEHGRWQGEVTQHRRDGSIINVLGSITLFMDDNGAPLGIVAVNHDITERKQTEQALRLKLEQEHEFQESLKSLHEITIELTQIDQLDDFYRRAVELGRNRLGFERLALFLYDEQNGTAIGTYGTSVEGLTTDERDVVFEPDSDGLMLRAFQREERFAFEEDITLLTNERPTGRGWNAASILWDGNRSQGWLVADNLLQHKPASKAQLDILALYSLSLGTLLARKKTDAALRQSEANLKAIMNSASVGIFLTNRQGIIQLANQLAQEYGLLLYQHPLVAGKTSLFDLDVSDPANVEKRLERAFAGERMNVELVREVGTTTFVLDLRYDPVITAEGDVIGITLSFIDITKRKQAEKALEAYNAEVHDLYNNAPCGYHSVDANGLFVQINDTELAWLGYTREEVIGKMRIMDLMTPESRKVSEVGFPLFKARGWVKDQEFDLIRKDGSIMSVLVSASAITDADGNYLMSRSNLFDITERKRAEAALRESETKFRSLVEGAPEAIIISDDAGRITLVNAEAEKVFRYGRDEMIGQQVEMLVPTVQRDLHRHHRAGYAEAPRMRGRGEVTDVQGQRKGGETFYADIELSYIETQDGLLVMTFVADITERKHGEEAIRASEARYRLLADNITDVIARIDTSGIYQYVSPSSQAVLGYAPDELVGTSAFALIHPDDTANLVAMQMAAFGPDMPMRPAINRTRHKDGHYLWVETGGQLIRAEDSGEVVGYITVSRDVTERQKAQEALKQSEALLRKVLENLPVGVWLVSPDGTITMSNRAGEQIWAGARDFRASEQHEGWWPETGGRIPAGGSAERAIQLGEASFNEEMEIEARDGDRKYLLNSSTPIHDSEGKLQGMIVVNQDVTVLKIAENALREAFEKEKELNELKSRFVSMASHEFRTPLATILSSSEMLLNYRIRMDDQKIDHRLKTIAGQVKHLTSIVEDVLDLTRMQTGKAEYKPLPTDLDLLCREIIDEFRSQPDIRQTIRYQCERTPAIVTLDKKLIRQVIINLMANATKYSAADKTISVTLGYGEKEAVLRVRDQGIGIPEADLRYLFQPFHRAANVGTISGTGLGLSITKEAVEMHGGKVDVESRLDAGTTFTVTLPLNPPAAVREPPQSDDRML